jgi:hypothetical protein
MRSGVPAGKYKIQENVGKSKTKREEKEEKP